MSKVYVITKAVKELISHTFSALHPPGHYERSRIKRHNDLSLLNQLIPAFTQPKSSQMHMFTNTKRPLSWPGRLAVSTLLLLITLFTSFSSMAQTERITPAGDGSFSNGSTFGANGWTVSNSANNPWVVGNLYTTGSAPFAGASAYISENGGTTSTYTPTNNATNFFWRDVTVPAGETVISLSFNWQQQGEATWDIWQVYYGPTSITPVGVATHPGSGVTTIPAGLTGATVIGAGSVLTGVQTFTATLPASLAGTTFRLFFSWKNETGGVQPPAAIDNISLTSRLPVPADAAPTTFNDHWMD
jgi:hypothetical protein